MRIASPSIVCLLALVPGACANSAMTANEPLPDWRGPAVHCRFLGDRGIQVELTAPTAGHSFALTSVAVRDGRADAEFRWSKPGPDMIVAQVVTPLRVDVAADRLLDARAVWIWIRDADDTRRLAIASARP